MNSSQNKRRSEPQASKSKGSKKGLALFEWPMLIYVALTTALVFFMQTRLHNPMSMLVLRFQTVAMMLALWGVYRMWPCRLTMGFRMLLQVALLNTWYPETFEFCRMLPNLDHVFANLDQQVFGFQPALLFSQQVTHPVVSELLTVGYLSYFPMIAGVPLYYLFYRYDEFRRVLFVMMASFFTFYVVFVFLPVAGPQFYYPVVGIDQIAQGVFPAAGDYFETHSTELMLTPGYEQGVFHRLLVAAHEVGENPTAAFPSSHVGITTVFLLLALRTGARRLFWVLLPFAILMFFATVYIMAHYAVDTVAGLIAGVLMYAVFNGCYRCKIM